jgi:hypothetical protein
MASRDKNRVVIMAGLVQPIILVTSPQPVPCSRTPPSTTSSAAPAHVHTSRPLGARR